MTKTVTKKKKVGRKRQGTEIKKSFSIRIEPKVRAKLIRELGGPSKSFQKAIDTLIERELGKGVDK